MSRPKMMTCGLCGGRRRVLWSQCEVCGAGMCGECADPKAHVADCRRQEELCAPCARCGDPGCFGPWACEEAEAEAAGKVEYARTMAAWMAGEDFPGQAAPPE
jgi:hypothetical protein